MQLKYRLYRRRNGVFYWQENDSKKQGTLRTSDRREAERLLNAMNESHLEKLLGDEIRARSKRTLVQSREFSEMLKKTLSAYHNRAIATQEVIEELIKLAKHLKEADQCGVDLGLNDEEVAFYDAWPRTTVQLK